MLAAASRPVALAPQGADPCGRGRGRRRARSAIPATASTPATPHRHGAAGRAGRAAGRARSRSRIVYEDDALIVIDKPAGLVVHPAAGNWTGTLVNALIAHCGDSLSGIGGVKRPGIVHRLDKDTSGLMVVAKTDRAHRALAASSPTTAAPGRCERGYLAFVWGVPRPAARARSTRRSTATRMRATKMAVRAGRARGDHPLAGAGALSGRRRRRPVAEPARLPAGDRPHPPDSGASRPYRPSAAGRRRSMGPDFKTKAEPSCRPAARRGAGRPWHGRPCMPICWASSIPSPANTWSSARNCRPISPVYA